ncbi:glycosyl hydrolase 53 family protein [Luteimicrobium subarcticum]|uniref:Arabinogalactan endo-beta-1,4-galactanase n=1 Tax=Luteimicrobium subarcticum TaxID=620910 RepID=A0A2M8W712_9MICO|nr:glycosyl hydrolase 53 family protein [Luteimicrobium subarcticum]PJI86684.1 endo-1,4-beta-galactanase [Luteimicrobium subarcticum]
MQLSYRPRRRRLVATATLTAIGLLAPASAAWAGPHGSGSTGSTHGTGSTGPVRAGVTVRQVTGLPADFSTGVDVSTVLSEEESGVVFHDARGKRADLFTVLKESGVNDVRIRIWNDPSDGSGHGYGAGNVDVARAKEIGERATAAGMKVLLDFHYSDFWADPSKQQAPKAWAGYTVDQTVAAVTSFTTTTLQDFKAAGVDVGMVQVGNETNNGVAGVTGMADMSRVFSAGSAAVRAVLPDALVAVHFTDPENGYATIAAQLDEYGVDYDVFASSYYPYWHGSLANLTAQLKAVADTYGKKVMVAETSWAYTLADGDGEPNTIASASVATQYPVSVQGQATEVHDVVQAVHDVGAAGIGVFYWEPAWIPVGPASTLAANQQKWTAFGSGWATAAASAYDKDAAGVAAGTDPGGSGWDNQAMFDASGYPLASLKVFSYVRTGSVAPLAVYSVAPVDLALAVGDPVQLPRTLAVTYNDGRAVRERVSWADVLDDVSGAGTYSIPGTVTTHTARGTVPLSVTATVTVRAVDHVVDGSFESGSSAWTVTGTGASIKATGDASDGTTALAFWLDTPFSFTGSQTISGLAPGAYTLTSTGQGGALGTGDTVDLFATTSAGTVTAPYGLTAWSELHTPTLQVTVPADGTVTIGARGTLSSGAWGALDDFRLVATTTPVDTSALRALVARAAAVDRSRYTARSLATLDAAVTGADVTLGATAPAPAVLSRVTRALRTALDGLTKVAPVHRGPGASHQR